MNSYFIHSGSEQTGPFTLEELKSKGVSKDSLVWREGLADWIKAGELPELNVLFMTAPPPFVEKEMPAQNAALSQTTTPVSSTASETVTTSQATTAKAFAASTTKKLSPGILIGLLVIIAAGIGAYFYFTSDKNKNSDADKNKIAALTDSTTKKDSIKTDTTKKSNLDSLQSNWGVTDTASTQTTQKTDTTSQQGFTIGGMPVNNTKTKTKTVTVKDQPKTKEKKVDRHNNTNANTNFNTTPPAPERVPVKSLQVSGGFRKNLIFEAVLEGSIQNPNNNVSFHNVIVTVHFINADGEMVGTKEFPHNGVIRGGETVSFKFKTNPPKGSKSARYSVTGSSS